MRLGRLLLCILGITRIAVAQAAPRPQVANQANKGGDSPASTGRGPNATKQGSFHPNGVAVGMGVAVPGAIVCDDLASVRLVARRYMQHWEDAEQDVMTHGASKILRGPSSHAPKPSAYGCSLLPAGTPVQVTKSLPGAVVLTAKASDGHTVHGVTQSNMVGQPPDETQSEGVKPSSSGIGPDTSQPVQPGKNGVGFPNCISCPDPSMPSAELGKNFQGTVKLQIVVGVDGHTRDIQVLNSLGHDFDEAAIAAVTRWIFRPVTGPNGAPVPTIADSERNRSGFRADCDHHSALIAITIPN